MHTIIITTVVLLFTFVTALDVRKEHKTTLDSQCFICPPVKSFRFGIRPWQRYEPSDIKFEQHENSFSCIYKTTAYASTDKYNSLTVIGRCNYYEDGVLKRENKDKDTLSSVECPRVAPSYKGCGYRVHAARAVQKRQEPEEQTPQVNPPAYPPGVTITPPGGSVTDEDEPDEDEEDGNEEGDEEESDGGEGDEDEDEDEDEEDWEDEITR